MEELQHCSVKPTPDWHIFDKPLKYHGLANIAAFNITERARKQYKEKTSRDGTTDKDFDTYLTNILAADLANECQRLEKERDTQEAEKVNSTTERKPLNIKIGK